MKAVQLSSLSLRVPTAANDVQAKPDRSPAVQYTTTLASGSMLLALGTAVLNVSALPEAMVSAIPGPDGSSNLASWLMTACSYSAGVRVSSRTTFEFGSSSQLFNVSTVTCFAAVILSYPSHILSYSASTSSRFKSPCDVLLHLPPMINAWPNLKTL
eukprot:CAMPEP_0204401888 /NCGR_PEP_ID=MMETSP0470-20130426/4961_1 /ASSEMBLY_ACC=CAM_ASM_000385 /TAXON_ID=2969 /ORGANISM="Oxyrrhis marina" /LENGTH=156 /DNA_ID=CAMNT_0051396907 /DNA_START=177 /DNA_END=644 /DNA_ORIENTATION=-